MGKIFNCLNNLLYLPYYVWIKENTQKYSDADGSGNCHVYVLGSKG